MRALALLLATAPPSAHEVPPGFTVERAADVAASLIALSFDPSAAGACAIVSLEDGGLLWLEDAEGDGFFESSGELTDAIAACQGMCWLEGRLLAVGSVDGVLGVHRMTLAEDRRSVERIELLAAVIGDPGEHGAHGIVVGPDGMLYLTLGDHVRMEDDPEPETPVTQVITPRGICTSIPLRLCSLAFFMVIQRCAFRRTGGTAMTSSPER
jgi:glucose/arabinose dehydrogenase